MIYGYIRVSTDKQTVENQRFEIEKYCKKNNISISKWIEETISGTKKVTDRKLGKLLKGLEKGDILRTPDGTQRYEVQDVENGLVTLEDGTSTNIDFRNMQKEEIDCHPTLWNIL